MIQQPASTLIRVSRVAAMFGVSRRTLIDSIESGDVKLRLVRIGRRRIPHCWSAEVDALIKEGSMQ